MPGGPCRARSETLPDFSYHDWQAYCNDREGYCIKLAPELKVNYTKRNEHDWAAANRMPFDYVNFCPAQAGAAGFFELGVGVHENRRGLAVRAFAESKDDGVRRGVRQYVMVRQSDITVGGCKGVRDDFKLERESGWWSYSRIIVPRGGKFYVLLGTLGRDNPIQEYALLYQRLIDSFEVKTVQP